MQRTVFADEHDACHKTVRALVESKVGPVHDQWDEAGIVPREFCYPPAELGVFGGYGYITEYPAARPYAGNRVNRIYGGKDMGR